MKQKRIFTKHVQQTLTHGKNISQGLYEVIVRSDLSLVDLLFMSKTTLIKTCV